MALAPIFLAAAAWLAMSVVAAPVVGGMARLRDDPARSSARVPDTEPPQPGSMR